MFKKRFETLTVDGFEFTVWVNPPRGQLVARGTNDVDMLSYILSGWNLGGEEYDGFVFPEAPTEEAIAALPLDVVINIAQTYGDAVRNSLPKPSAARSSRSTRA